MNRLLDAPLPRQAGWGHVLGSALLWAFLLQLVTGVLLSMYYSPTEERAYASVAYIQDRMTAGATIRAMHHYGATAVIILAALHLARVFFLRAYLDRRSAWVLGWIAFLAILGLGFTGYTLPRDMNAYFSLQVGANVAGLIPGIGDSIVQFLYGGPTMEEWTLQRIFTLHAVVLPCVVLLASIAHVLRVSQKGLVGEPSEKRFHPDLLPKIAAAVFVLTLAWVGLAASRPIPMEPPADPTNATYVPHPEWYFFGFQQLLRMFEGTGEFVGAILIPFAVIAALVALPWYDRRPESRGRVRAACGVALLLGYSALTVAGYRAYLHDVANAPKPMVDVAPPRLDYAWMEAGEPDTELVDLGQHYYQALNCAVCHETPEVGRAMNVPAELASAGDRLRPRWTVEYLRRPWPIRFEDRQKRPHGRMPDFRLTEEEAVALAAYLTTLHDPARVPVAGIDWKTPDRRKTAEGADLYRRLLCFQCHKINGEGEEMGPDLSKIARRLKPDYMHAIIGAPQKILPGTKMKYDDLPPEHVEALVRYLQTLK